MVGPDDFLAERAVADRQAAWRSNDPDAEITRIAAGELSPGAVAEALGPSLFGGRRLLVVEDADQLDDGVAEALLATLADDPDDAAAVVVHPGGVKGKKVLERVKAAAAETVRCDRPVRLDDWLTFVHQELRRAKVRIEGPAAARLVEAVGRDLRALAAACDQLASDIEGSTVEEADVAAFFDGRAEVRGWSIADHLVDGRSDTALGELRWALATGTDPVLVIGAVAGSLRTLAMLIGVPRTAPEAELARELGVPGWKVRILRNQVRGWTPAGLSRAIQAVARADLAVKGAATDPVLALTTMVLDVGAAHGPARSRVR